MESNEEEIERMLRESLHSKALYEARMARRAAGMETDQDRRMRENDERAY